jgi:DNA repair protein RecO (recombination protein O)
LLIASLIDHDPDQNFYTQLKNYIHEICLQNNIGGYVLFEKDLLACCGFGLDLRRCAITNSVKNLAYVSPKTGRAVIEVVGAPYKTQLFKLPVQLYNSDIITWTHEDVLEGLKMTGYFLDQMFQNHLHRIVPSERDFVVKLVHKTKKDNYVS